MSALGHTSLFAPNPPITILGVPFDPVTRDEAVSLIEQMIASRQPHYVVTPNVDFLVQATADVELRRILFEAHLVVCDGKPLIWASRWLGNRLPERIAGADLAPLLVRLAVQKGYRLFFLGASEASAGKAMARLRQEYPNLVIAGHYSPPFNELLEMDHAVIEAKVKAAQADLLFVSFGCPKQEKWISMHYRSLGVPVTLGVGGTIDFLAGQVRRAPVWVQQAGAEWLFRLAQEPGRLLHRYTRDLWGFSRAFVSQWLRLSPALRFAGWARARRGATSSLGPHGFFPSLSPDQGSPLQLPRWLDSEAVRQRTFMTRQPTDFAGHCFLDASSVEFIDSTGIGFLIQLQKRLSRAGYCLVLINPSRAVGRALKLLRLQDFFTIAADLKSAQETAMAKLREELVTSKPSRGDGSSEDHELWILWHGEITAATAGQVWEKTSGLLENGASANAWGIDLSNVRFIDSSGLGLMLRVKKLARERDKVLNFTGLQPAVRNVIQLAGLAEFLLGAALRRRAVSAAA